MIRALFLCASLALPAFASAASGEMPSRTFVSHEATLRPQFKAPAVPISVKAWLPAMSAGEKAAREPAKTGGALKIGDVRPLAKAAAMPAWTPVAGGFVTRLHVAAETALGLRVRLDLSGVATPLEVRAQGNDGRIFARVVDPARGAEAWTPTTEGSEQVIEVFSPVALDPGAVRMGALLHLTESPSAKAASTCTISTACSTGDAALDAAMAERKKSVARMFWVEGNLGFNCTGTLINTERFPEAFFMTAAHCIKSSQAAASLETRWFYEDGSCTGGVPGGVESNSGGAELVFTTYDLDQTLLKLNSPPPSGAVYAGWSVQPLAAGAPIFSISHPKGDTSRWATGAYVGDDERTGSLGQVQQFHGATLTRGFIEGGSSGSGMFTLANGSFQFRGTLLGGDENASCTSTNVFVVYGRFDIFEPQIDQYIGATPKAADDAPNRARDLLTTPFSDPQGFDLPLNNRTTTLALDNRRIDYVGDLDVYRFRVTAPAWVSLWTEGAEDTIGEIMDSRGVHMVSEDDWQVGAPYNFGITKLLNPGTYYLKIGHFEAKGTGTYHLRMRADAVDANYTALWWNPAENGWGLNLNHQGTTLFGTLYTYDASGNPTWFSMADGAKQPDGSYQGQLVSTTGPAFDSSPWNPNAVTRSVVGTMRLSFFGDDNGTVTYNVGGAQVTKSITKLAFQLPPVCTWSASNRSQETNFQDLWWGGESESGWGVNLAHQGNIIFATLFTYDAAGQPRWFVMSNGQRNGLSAYTGTLYRTTGPAFNAVPFTPITEANNVAVGAMTFSFTNGNAGTMTYTVNGSPVTKIIKRLEFGAIKPKCTQPS